MTTFFQNLRFAVRALTRAPGFASAAILALVVAAALLAVGSAAVFPFEMDTVVSLANNRLVGTHYGFYNTIVGIGMALGAFFSGWVVDSYGARNGFWVSVAAAIVALAVVALGQKKLAGEKNAALVTSPIPCANDPATFRTDV